MQNELSIISKIIEWHQTIRTHVKLVGESITDREALSSLQKSRANWVPGQLEILAEKQKNLQRATSSLGDGLKNHFSYEEKVLPPLLGELFMRALILDHREIMREIGEAKKIVANTRLEGLSREDLLARESEIHQVIDSMCQAVEEHSTREEIILEMLQRALRDKQRSQTQPD